MDRRVDPQWVVTVLISGNTRARWDPTSVYLLPDAAGVLVILRKRAQRATEGAGTRLRSQATGIHVMSFPLIFTVNSQQRIRCDPSCEFVILRKRAQRATEGARTRLRSQ